MSLSDQEIPVFKKADQVQKTQKVLKPSLRLAPRIKPPVAGSRKKEFAAYFVVAILLVYGIFVTRLMLRFASEANDKEGEIAKIQNENEVLKNSREKLLLESVSKSEAGAVDIDGQKDKVIESQKNQIASLLSKLKNLEMNLDNKQERLNELTDELAKVQSSLNDEKRRVGDAKPSRYSSVERTKTKSSQLYNSFNQFLGSVRTSGQTQVQKDRNLEDNKQNQEWSDAQAN